MHTSEPERKHIEAVETSFAIIDTLRRHGEATVTEVARELGIAKSTVSVHLATLYDEGYLVKDGTAYALGLKYLRAGQQARCRHELSQIVQPVLERLATETGEVAWYMVEEHGKGVYLNKALGDDAVQPYGRIGKRVLLHDIAAGKAILAHLPESRVQDIVDAHGLTEHTDTTISTETELFDAIERIRERGFALNRDETFRGFRAAAAPVLDGDTLLGSVVVSGPRSRMAGDRLESEVSSLVVDAANELELLWRTRSNNWQRNS